MSCQMITTPVPSVGEGSSSAPTVPSYRREGQSSPTLHHWSARSGNTSRSHMYLGFGQQLSGEPLGSLNSWASQGVVEFHLHPNLPHPVPEKAEPSLHWSFCPRLNQTPSITCPLGSPANPSTNLLVREENHYGKGLEATGLGAIYPQETSCPQSPL